MDPAVDDVQAVPAALVDERHQLAAGEVADAGDEGGVLGLLRQAVSFDVEEFGGAVHREAPGPRPARAAAEVGRQQRDIGGDVGEVDVDVADAPLGQATPDQHRLGEVKELPEQPAEAARGEAERAQQGREVGDGCAAQGGEVGARDLSR